MGRNKELDSLRGLAALSVLGYHAFATNFPSIAAGIHLGEVGPVAAFAVYSPLHLLWLGAESVWFFFVLSGFVLTRSAMRPGFSWPAYYPSRLVRLYLPVAVAVALAWLTYQIPHLPRPGLDPMLPTGYPLEGVLRDITLLGGTTTSLGVLWSLQWEIVFSLLLPVYVLLVRSRPLPAAIIAVLGCLVGWSFSEGVLTYLPMFFIGGLLAQYWPTVQRRFAFLAGSGWRTHILGGALTMAGALGILSYFLLGRLVAPLYDPRVLTLPLVLAGIIVVIVVAQMWPPLSRLLSTKPFVAAGMISFSLYLVHLPLVVLFAFVLPLGVWGTVLSVVVSLLVAVAFYFVVERPSHQLSRRIASRLRAEELEPTPSDGRVSVSS
jgi:peptidoglycan/LPS O-acetylase OafA/YrhL